MSLEIIPQNITIYPNDRRLFRMRTKDLTPYWANVELTNLTKGVVDPDFSVRRVGLANNVRAEAALQLAGGLGAVEFTITPRCKPNNAGAFGMQWKFFFQGDTVKDYYVILLLNTISIEYSGGLLATLNHVTAVGDKFRIELSNGFRLFINGILRHERLIGGISGTIKYPATYEATVREFVQEQPSTIPAPLLEGDWQLRPVVTFITPSHGSISSPGPGISTEYFNGTIPGRYTLEGRIEPGMDIWFENGPPAGASISIGGGGLWGWQALNPFPSAAPGSGPNALSGPNAAGGPALTGQHEYFANNATQTLQINPGDVFSFWVWLDPVNTPQEIFIQLGATDSTGFNHRAFWGADLINIGTLGTPGKRFMGALPPTNQWVRLEIPASLIDLEGRVVNGISLNFWDSKGGFDQFAKIPRALQRAEALITIPPLQIIGDLERALQPGKKVKLQTNYDVTLTPPTWSVVSGGGSFVGDEFTAPAVPGPTVVRASVSGNQVADLTINVPAIITPSFPAAGSGEQIDFNTNIGPMPVFVAAGTVAEGTGDITPGIPPGIQKNDILALTVESANESVPTPAGWGIVANSPQGTGTGGGTASTRLSKFWLRVPDSGIVAAPLLVDVGDHQIARIRAYRNCIDTGNPWDITVGNTAASSTSVSLPGGATTVPNCLVIQAVAHATDTATPQLSGIANADLANLSEVEDLATTQGNGGGFAIVEGQKAAAGAFGATTATLANGSVQARLTVALRPAVAVWSASAGSMNSSTGVWQAPVVTDPERPVKITVSNGTFTATLDVLVLPIFPLSNPSAPLTVDLNKTVLISISEDRSSYIARVKDKDGRSYLTQEVQFLNCELDELEDVIEFWEVNYPGKQIILEDNSRPAKPRIVCYLDSSLRYQIESSCAVNISFRVREA